MTGDRQAGSILSLDNIPLELPLAGPASRVLAAGIDYVFLMVLLLLWVLLSLVLANYLSGSWALAVVLIGAFLLEQGYFMGWEIALGGRTPGKMAMRLRVLREDGGQPDTTALVLRNLLRLVDLILGVLLMIQDSRSRRLGDRLAGTLVVHQRPEERRQPVLGRVPGAWGPREVAVAESLLARRAELEPDQATFLARRILAWVERDAPQWLGGEDPEADPLAALSRALAVTEEPAR